MLRLFERLYSASAGAATKVEHANVCINSLLRWDTVTSSDSMGSISVLIGWRVVQVRLTRYVRDGFIPGTVVVRLRTPSARALTRPAALQLRPGPNGAISSGGSSREGGLKQRFHISQCLQARFCPGVVA